jgi:hypothetical protein
MDEVGLFGLTATLPINGRLTLAQSIAVFAGESSKYIAFAPIGGEDGNVYLYRYRNIHAGGEEGIELIDMVTDKRVMAAKTETWPKKRLLRGRYHERR